jgi:predicted lipoprotein with Yx(FWY)xxD motif
MLRLFVPAFAVLLAASSSALAQTPAPAKAASTDKGSALVDAKGMTLYTFDRDTTGKSACNGQCASNWPPLVVSAGATPQGEWTVVTRDDGTSQWAYKGKPLYTWAKDSKAGDATGDGMANGAWHIAKP